MIQDKTLQRDPEFHTKMVVGTEARLSRYLFVSTQTVSTECQLLAMAADFNHTHTPFFQ